MLSNSLGPNEIQRLKDLIYDGVKTKEEIQTLKEGMSDTVKAISEELQLPASLLKKAIDIAFKGDFEKHKNELDELDEILSKTGRK